MKRKILLCGILALTLIFSACSSKKSSSGTQSMANNRADISNNMANSSSQVAVGAGDAKGANDANVKQEAKPQDQQSSDIKIIKNATLYIVEGDLVKLADSIYKKAQDLGGYVESEETTDTRVSARVRIPAEKFDAFIAYSEKGFNVKNKNISSENITDAYVDNEARLNNLKAQEQQMLEILKKANTVEDVLKVQTELYKIRGDAEALEAKKKSWDKQVDYATITINADKNVIVAESKKSIIGGSEFIKSIGKGFSNTSVALILAIEHILIFLISNIIILIILAIAAFFGVKLYKKYSSK